MKAIMNNHLHDWNLQQLLFYKASNSTLKLVHIVRNLTQWARRNAAKRCPSCNDHQVHDSSKLNMKCWALRIYVRMLMSEWICDHSELTYWTWGHAPQHIVIYIITLFIYTLLSPTEKVYSWNCIEIHTIINGQGNWRHWGWSAPFESTGELILSAFCHGGTLINKLVKLGSNHMP